jgi:signal recognition particle subunit SRP54
MFEVLTEKLTKIFSGLNNKGRLSEKEIDEALRQIRLALLEADVNFKVVKSFLTVVRE